MSKKFVKLLCVTLAAVCTAGLFTGCGKGAEDPYAFLDGYEEGILDPKLTKGLDLLGTVSIRDGLEVFREYRYQNSVKGDALWNLAQWGTKFDLKTADEVKNGDTYTIKDNTKEVVVNPVTGEYSLNCYAGEEYPEPRKNGEDWLHLIVQQNVVEQARLDELEAVYADLDFTVPKVENLMGNKFNPSLHTALLQWVFTIKNENPSSPDYGDYMWINLPYYDPRYEFVPESTHMDFGKEDKTDSLIHSVAGDKLLSKPVKIGERTRSVYNMMPELERALTLAKERDILLHTELSDLRIGMFYIGWEVPGTFNAEFTVHRMSLKFVRKEA